MNKISILLILILMVSCVSKRRYNEGYKSINTNQKRSVENNEEVTLADKVIWSAFKFRGVKYKYGGMTKDGIDCSALTMISFRERGVSIPRTSYEQFKFGVPITLDDAKRGDLIFFKTNPRKPNKISHVGIITHIKNGVVQFLHASTKRGVELNKMDQNYYKKRFAGVRRVLN